MHRLNAVLRAAGGMASSCRRTSICRVEKDIFTLFVKVELFLLFELFESCAGVRKKKSE